MKYSRILLVRTSVQFFGSYLPIGLGILSEILKDKAVDHEVMDMNIGNKVDDLISKISVFKPDLIGISLLSVTYKEAYDLLRKIKKIFPNVDIVVGGPHISIFKESVLKQCEAIDLGVIGEGEKVLVELCSGKQLEDIKGLIYRNGNEIVFSGDRKLITNLDSFPFPKYEKFEINKYEKIIPVYSSRGCPYRCTFCSVHQVIGRGFRAKTAEYVLNELKYWYFQGYRHIYFFDDDFSQDLERIFRLCKLLKKEKINHLRMSCADVRADKLNKDLLKAMWEVGFREVDLGVEGGNNKVLKSIKKGETLERIEETIRDACDLGFNVQLFFQIGFPGQTVSDIEDAVEFALKYPIKRAHFFNTVPTPNTELYKWVIQNSRLLEKPEDYMNGAYHTVNKPLFETAELSLEDRKKMLDYTSKISILTSKNYYSRKFKKYGLLGQLIVIIGFNKAFIKLRENTKLWNIISSVPKRLLKA